MKSTKKPTILAVDDTPEYLSLLTSLLGETYNMKSAINGIIALKIAQASVQPDLILLDVMMPGMSGFDVARELQMNEATKNIPVIFVTANTDQASIAEGFSVGGVDYVTKPFNPSELRARVETHLSLKAARARLENLANKLGKYLSPTVYDSIFKGEKEVEIGSYRKVLSVCFTDIVNFTERLERMDQRKLTTWLNGYLTEMAQIALGADGTLDKFIGDAVMVFFGDPKSEGIEQDALKCVRMAEAMITQAEHYNVQIRVGINTGMCIIGNFGSEDRMDYTILGKEVNLAQRLEQHGIPNRIMISESTYQLIHEQKSCAVHGHVQMKGIERDIETYLVDK